LADRRCFPDPALPFLAQTYGATYRHTAVGETVAKQLVDLNAGPAALPDRRVPGLLVEPDEGRGTPFDAVLRYDPLLDVLKVIARDGGPFGFRVAHTPAGARFEVFTPPDLSGTVRFSLGLGNLAGLKYRDSAPTATYAMCEGIIPAYNDESIPMTYPAQPLRYAEATSDPASLDYGRRAEVWSDAGESVEAVEDVQAPVRDALGAGTTVVGLTLDPSPDYLLDADPALLLGARVTVQVGPLGYTDTLPVVDVVREVRLLYDLQAGTDDVTPVVGSDGAAADTLLPPYVGDMNRRLAQLERR
jgi:hypothetical protein